MVLVAAAAIATLAAPASAQVPIPASIGELTGRPMQYDGKHVSVTGTLLVRGTALWLQLCSDGPTPTCIYVDHGDRIRASAGQTMTISGMFLAHAIVRNTQITNVLVLDPAP
ncbi:MAG TPA: hypothetical protein VHT53_09525 [Candidatus Elarobacter sp.]|nr:hypothetical protein [Candidatus Elarobacter sp.]